jgi:hypothetical protein
MYVHLKPPGGAAANSNKGPFSATQSIPMRATTASGSGQVLIISSRGGAGKPIKMWLAKI